MSSISHTHEVLKLDPCPKCGEREKLSTELHPGTALAVCDVCKHRGPEFLPPREKERERELLAAVVNGWNRAARSIRERNLPSRRVAAKDLKEGDTVRWDSPHGIVQGRIHEIEEKPHGVRTIRLEPIGSHSRMLNADDKVEVLLV